MYKDGRVEHFARLNKYFIQRYERYLPTAFDESMTLLEKVNKVIEGLNTIVRHINDQSETLEEWQTDLLNDLDTTLDDYMNELNTLKENYETFRQQIIDDLLPESTSNILNQWLEDGTLEHIINHDIFNTLNTQLEQAGEHINRLEHTVDEIDESIDIRSYEYDSGCVVVFQFDDGQVADIERFMPIFDSEGVPGNVCVMTGNVGTDDAVWMNETQLKMLKDKGWTVSSHTVTHPRLGDLTSRSQLHYELGESSKWLKERGFDHDILVWPHGSVSDLAIEVARNYYEYAVDIHRYNPNYPPHFNNMEISRVHGLSSEVVNLDDCKSLVDEAIETGNLLIFNDHSHYSFWNNSANLEILRELIQYIKSKNVPIVNLKDGIRKKANIIDTGFARDHVRVTRDGRLVSPSSAYGMYIGLNNMVNDTPITEFPQGRVTEYRFTNQQATNGNFPTGTGGVYIVHRHTQDTYSYATYKPYNSNNEFKRRWNHVLEEWEEWVAPSENLIRQSQFNDYTASTPLTTFEKGVTITPLNEGVTIGNGYPVDAQSAFLETHYYETIANYQVFRSGANKFERRWLVTSNVWSDWVAL